MYKSSGCCGIYFLKNKNKKIRIKTCVLRKDIAKQQKLNKPINSVKNSKECKE